MSYCFVFGAHCCFCIVSLDLFISSWLLALLKREWLSFRIHEMTLWIYPLLLMSYCFDAIQFLIVFWWLQGDPRESWICPENTHHCVKPILVSWRERVNCGYVYFSSWYSVILRMHTLRQCSWERWGHCMIWSRSSSQLLHNAQHCWPPSNLLRNLAVWRRLCANWTEWVDYWTLWLLPRVRSSWLCQNQTSSSGSVSKDILSAVLRTTPIPRLLQIETLLSRLKTPGWLLLWQHQREWWYAWYQWY